MTVTIVDEDWSKADPAALKAAGYSGAIGYVSEDTTGKNITRGQVDALHAAGLDVGLVYEYSPGAAALGTARGTRDAGIAVAHAQQLGAPRSVCLYAAVDFQPTAAQLPAVGSYAAAFQTECAAAGYRAGIYGSYATCQYLGQRGFFGLLWQTYAWSSGAWWPGAVVRQVQNGIHVASATVDRDEALVIDWGQWPAPPVPTSNKEATSMLLRFPDTGLCVVTDGLGNWKGIPDPDALGVVLKATGLSLVDVTDDQARKLGVDRANPPVPVPVDVHALALEVVTELETAGLLTADSFKQALNAKLAAAQAA